MQESGLLAVRTAIVHDWFQGFHGAERVVDAMRVGLFDERFAPDVFTFHAARELLPKELSDSIVRESRVARLPFLRQRGHDPGRWRLLLPYMPRYFRGLRLSEYDLVISSSHAAALNARARGDAVHVCYCYTPMRYAWLPRLERERGGRLSRYALRAVRRRLRRVDLEASAGPDAFVAISESVRARIRTFYGRDATVIHPPVDVDDLAPSRDKDREHFLWVHRLVPYKRPELVAEAFAELPYRLTMVGVGPCEAELRKRLPKNVELRGWIDRAELVRLYATAGGFVHIGEEDFGISMVESLASGTPVIAADAGGARDIVRPGVDGLLIDRIDVETTRQAVRRVVETDWDREELVRRGLQFSRGRFERSLGAFLGGMVAART
jgi:glycosyltransferase involved in cell wall biosynthesis